MSSRQTVGWAGVVGLSIALSPLSCGSVSETDAPSSNPLEALALAKGGQRLAALAYRAGEATQFRLLYDRQLGTPCSFALDSANAGLRCTPSQVTRLIYLDDQCTDPATWLDYGTKEGDSVSVGSEAGLCPGDLPPHRAAFVVGKQVYDGAISGTRPEPVYARKGADCVVTFGDAKSDPPVNRLSPIADDELVAAHTVDLDVGNRLRVTRVVADDGAELNLGVTTSARACTLEPEGQCVPEPVAKPSNNVALDANCEHAAYASVLPASCGMPRYGIEAGGASGVFELQAAPELFQSNAALDTSLQATGLTYSCDALGSDNGMGNFAPGKDVSRELPRAATVHVGSGPLHLDVFTVPSSGSGSALDAPRVELRAQQRVGEFLDERGKPCQVQPTTDGLRCLPNEASVTEAEYFEDATCTQRLYYVDSGRGTPVVPPSLEPLRFVGYATGGVITSLHRLTAYTGPLHGWFSGQCRAAPADGQPWLAVGESVPLDSLPSVEETEL